MVKKEGSASKRIKKMISSVIIAMIITYFLVGLYLFFFQKSMIYFPNDQDFESCTGFKDYEKINHNGTRFYLKQISDQAIIYYHGNAGSACDRSFIKDLFEQ